MQAGTFQRHIAVYLGTTSHQSSCNWWVAVGVEEDVCGVCVWRVRVACACACGVCVMYCIVYYPCIQPAMSRFGFLKNQYQERCKMTGMAFMESRETLRKSKPPRLHLHHQVSGRGGQMVGGVDPRRDPRTRVSGTPANFKRRIL